MVRYKAIVSNKNIYRELELLPETRVLTVGTAKNANVRLRKDSFFGDVEFSFENIGEGWQLRCGENNYVSTDGIVKLTGKELSHGDDLVIKYRDSNQEIFAISYVIDFDYDTKDYERVIEIADRETLTIGGSSDCDIVLDDPLVAQDIVVLQKAQGQWRIEDKQTKYGVYVNGIKIRGQAVVSDFDFFSIVGYSFYQKYGKLYTTQKNTLQVGDLSEDIVSESDGKFEYPKFNRSTRLRYSIKKEEIPILDPPAIPAKPQQNLVLSLVPALAMLAVTVFLRGQMGGGGSFVIFSAITMSIGIVTSIFSYIGQTRKYKKDTAKRAEKYHEYIENKRRFVTERRKQERVFLEEVYFSPQRELEMVKDFSSDLFNRTAEDEDFLHVRIGTGAVSSNQPVGYKEQEKFESEDELALLPAQVAEEFQYLTAAPIIVDCANNGAIGIVGTRPKLYDIMKNILLDLSTRQYHNDLELFFMGGPEMVGKISWMRFLPHIYNDFLDMRNIIYNDESKNSLFEYLYKELSAREAEKRKTPYIVILVYDDLGIKRHPLSNYIDRAQELGVTFIFFEESKEQLPLGCSQVILLKNSDSSGEIVSSRDEAEVLQFSYEPIDDQQARFFAQKLAPVYCEEISLEGTLTKNISLFELLNVYSVQDIDLEERWRKSEIYKSMAAPLGVKSKSEVVALDLHEKYHGPHGLVAGTTGSGKSEILQSYILSMATLFHPYEVGFVIIDFKGGGMVNQFKDLPHLVGAITNIDGREINRSLLSIKAELRKRQTLFAQHDVNHIDAYIKLFKKGEATTPLPHLILIVDEFAELKMDQPEFMKELISAARIGRSLGVHLILATQKPSGVVDAQIWSNSKFKLCLKVQNKEDSNEVLKTPLAAEIKEPGRAYLQVGNNEIFELFQSAYSGAPAATDLERKKSYAVYNMDLAGKRTPIFTQKADKSGEQAETQLDVIVDYVAEYCEKSAIERLPGICLPPLQEVITYAESTIESSTQAPFAVPLGIYDDPNNQYQGQVELNLLAGNTFIVGASQFGKTALLQVLLRGIASSFTPAEMSVYILDFGSMALNIFSEMNHVGGVVTSSDEDKLKTFFRMIAKEIETRKEKFSQIGITSFASYWEAGYRDLPGITILLDNILAFRELYPDYDDMFLSFCREGLSVGINVVVTTQQTRNIGYRYLSNFSNKIALYCNQSDEYSSMFDRCRMEPKMVPGRGLIAIQKEIYEYQTFLAFEGEREIERVDGIKAFIAQINQQYAGLCARPIPEIPEILTAGYLAQNFDAPAAGQMVAGLDYGTVDVVKLDLLRLGFIAISGREGGGRTNFVQYLFADIAQRQAQQPVKAYIVDNFTRRMEALSGYDFVEKYTTDMADLNSLLPVLAEESDARKEKLKNEGLAAQKAMPLIIVAVHNEQFFENGGLEKEANDAYKKLLKAGKDTKIFFLLSALENASISYSAADPLKEIKENKNIIFFDNLAQLKLVDVALADIRNFKKPIEMGDAYYIRETGVMRIKTPFVAKSQP